MGKGKGEKTTKNACQTILILLNCDAQNSTHFYTLFDKKHQNHKNEKNQKQITDKSGEPVDDHHGQIYSDEKLIEIIDQSLDIMDTNSDGYVSYSEFITAQESLRKRPDAN